MIGIESNSSAIENARLNGVKAEFVCVPCKKEIARLKNNSTLWSWIRTEPAASLGVGCCHRPPPGKINYISCEPTTFARNLRVLTAAAYRAEYVQPVNMFPCTGQCETVCKLLRATAILMRTRL